MLAGVQTKDRGGGALAWAAAILSGLCQAAAHQDLALSPLSLLAAALFVPALAGDGPTSGGMRGAAWGLVVALGFVPQAPAAWVALLACTIFALVGTGIGTLAALAQRTRATAAREGPGAWVLAVALPAVAAGLEWWNGSSSPLGDYLGLSPALAGMPWILAVAPWGGPPAVAALGSGIGTAAGALLLDWRRGPGPRRASVAMLGAWLGLALVAWAAGSRAGPRGGVGEGQPLVVAAVAIPEASWRGRLGSDVVALLGGLTERAADQGAKLVVWPEAVVRMSAADGPAVREAIYSISRGNQLTLVAGAFDAVARRNLALVVGPDGTPRASYAKRHLVPGREAYVAGTEAPGVARAASSALDGGGTDLATDVGTLICFDDCFSDGIGPLRRGGARLLAVPTHDWAEVARRHRMLTPLRAAHAGAAIVRAANAGYSMIVDWRGRVLAEAPAPVDEPVLLLGTVEARAPAWGQD
jgi:apolipoprotein N-acyltransferase